ncbi:MAG TPA: hypothetical protein VHU40_06655, partial [Polyangia bacterium]|nr:hypothetical protein [Polyangia bacterium]
FARYLRSRGIALVLFPVPDKASLQPTQLHGRGGKDPAIPRNPDSDRFAAEMRAAGVTVFDPTPPSLRADEAPRFLRQDTHWTPAWMETVATSLAKTIVEDLHLPPPAKPRDWRATELSVSRLGDITDMLGLPEGQTLFAPDTITIRPVRDGADAAFEPSEAAEVLLLGDSFTNIFSLDQMGWGEGAGLGAHLARALGRDVDVIAQNDAGAFATRRLLATALEGASGDGAATDRLTGKKVVVWEFASRELAVGNWKPIAWPAAAPGPTKGSAAP